MESPVNPAVWRFLFNAAVGTLSAAALYSIYHEKRDMESTMAGSFRKLHTAKSSDDVEAQLSEILSRLQSDAVKKQAASRLSALSCGSVLVKMIKLAKDGSNADTCSAALRVVLRVYGPDAEGRRKLNDLGGFRVMLGSLSEAHRQGNQNLMEEFAEALRQLTTVDDSEVVLDTDVPEGSEGAYTLAVMPATVKMLRIVDPESPVLFLSALTGIFANLCTLSVGARNVGAGTDGHSGMSFFLALLDHGNRSVVENCVMAIRFMARMDIGKNEICKEENITRLADNLQVNAEPAVVNSIFTIILVMTDSEDYGAEFFANLAKSTIPTTIFDIWMRSAERILRARAEALCRLLSRLPPTAAATAALFERYRPQIEERRAKDEQEQQRQQQQMQQQQFMQRMMMEQMGMDPSMMGA